MSGLLRRSYFADVAARSLCHVAEIFRHRAQRSEADPIGEFLAQLGEVGGNHSRHVEDGAIGGIGIERGEPGREVAESPFHQVHRPLSRNVVDASALHAAFLAWCEARHVTPWREDLQGFDAHGRACA